MIAAFGCAPFRQGSVMGPFLRSGGGGKVPLLWESPPILPDNLLEIAGMSVGIISWRSPLYTLILLRLLGDTKLQLPCRVNLILVRIEEGNLLPEGSNNPLMEFLVVAKTGFFFGRMDVEVHQRRIDLQKKADMGKEILRGGQSNRRRK
jgi:hypothetical protein